MVRRIMCLLAFALLAAQLFGGAQSDTAKAGPLKVKLMTYWDLADPRQKAWGDVLDRFKAENPGSELVIEFVPSKDMLKQISIAAAGNALPDVIQMDSPWVASFAEMGILADITEDAKKSLPVDKYFAGPLNSGLYKGRTYALPLTSNNIALYVNADRLKAAGLGSGPQDWAQLKSHAAKLTGGGTFGVAISLTKQYATFQFLPYLWGAGSDIDKLDSPGTVAALDLMKDLVDSGSMSKEVLTWSQSDTSVQFIQQKAAMFVEGPWRLQNLESDAKFPWAATLIPKGPQTYASCLGGEDITLVKGPNASAGWKLIAHTQKDQNLLLLNLGKRTIVPRADLAAADPFYKEGALAVFVEMARYARPRGPSAQWPKFEEEIANMVQSVITHADTSAAAARKSAAVLAPFVK